MTSIDIPKTEPTAPEGAGYEQSWEPTMVQRIADIVKAHNDDGIGQPYMIALCGIPGSGTTISAFLMATLLENLGLQTMICPLDGYHYPLDYLRTFPDPEDMIYRRGSPDTFDPAALLRDLERIKHGGGEDSLIKLPGFDHAKADPEPEKHVFDRSQHRVVICFGLYLLLDEGGWENLRSVFDLRIFLNSDVDDCIERVKVRNQCIPGYSPEAIAERAERVDRVNAIIVLNTRDKADIVVQANAPEPSRPTSPTQLEKALTHIQQTTVDGIETHQHDSDWTMDIGTRPRSDSWAIEPRPPTFGEEVNANISHSKPEPPPAVAFVGSWEAEMADRIAREVDECGRTPFMVSLSGMPGSGKSVSTLLLSSFLEQKGLPTMVCPHDGYHYPLDYLKTFPDPDDAVYRRGAPDTFDPVALYRDLIRIRDGDEDVIKLPAFDHARGDPEPDTHIFNRKHHRVVLCEGLYLLHDRDGWEGIKSVFDLSIFMNTDLETCVQRVKVRNKCIPGYTPEEIEIRCEKVDRVNALTVLRSKARADVIVDALKVVSQ